MGSHFRARSAFCQLRLSTGLQIFSMLALFCLACLPAFPQGDTGRILGNVTDTSGANVAGASVTVTDVQRGVPRTLVTDSDGAYVALGLLPGTYTVRVDLKGFKTFERKNILVEVGKDVRVDVVLQPGAATEIVTVTEDVAMVDTTTRSCRSPITCWANSISITQKFRRQFRSCKRKWS